MEVGENFFSFTMDPHFLVQKPIISHKKENNGMSEQDIKDQEEEAKIK